MSLQLRAMFDDFCDSSEMGMRSVIHDDVVSGPFNIHPSHRKPEPEFYLLACQRNNIKPHEAVFLDDLGL